MRKDADTLDEIIKILWRPVTKHIDRKIGELMATVEEIRDQVATQLADVKSSLTAALDRVAADVAALQAQLDVDPSTFQPITDGLNEVKSSLDALDPVADVVVPPEEPPVEEPPVE